MVNNILNPKAQTPVETTTRVDPHIYEIGNAMFANAQQIASECDWLTSTIDTIAKAREDYEGGPFTSISPVCRKISKIWMYHGAMRRSVSWNVLLLPHVLTCWQPLNCTSIFERQMIYRASLSQCSMHWGMTVKCWTVKMVERR